MGECNLRIGFGYDAHRLVEKRQLILGGVHIPFARGLDGHSDADVLSHAIGDALLGAGALGDLGTHFPDSDMQFKNISSLVLLNKISHLLSKNGYGIVNIDATLVLQKPKIAPKIDEMRANIAQALNIEKQQVAIKATTTEGMGFTGSGEGVSSYAIALIRELDTLNGC